MGRRQEEHARLCRRLRPQGCQEQRRQPRRRPRCDGRPHRPGTRSRTARVSAERRDGCRLTSARPERKREAIRQSNRQEADSQDTQTLMSASRTTPRASRRRSAICVGVMPAAPVVRETRNDQAGLDSQFTPRSREAEKGERGEDASGGRQAGYRRAAEQEKSGSEGCMKQGGERALPMWTTTVMMSVSRSTWKGTWSPGCTCVTTCTDQNNLVSEQPAGGRQMLKERTRRRHTTTLAWAGVKSCGAESKLVTAIADRPVGRPPWCAWPRH